MKKTLLIIVLLVGQKHTFASPNHSGSGSSLFAIIQLGYYFVIYEIERHHYIPYVACSATELVDPIIDSSVKKIKYVAKDSTLTIIYNNRQKSCYSIDSIWGYSPKNLNNYRAYGSQVYKIKHIDTMSIYSRRWRWKKEIYFSQGLGGEMNLLTYENLIRVYAANKMFVHELDRITGKKRLRTEKDINRLMKFYNESILRD